MSDHTAIPNLDKFTVFFSGHLPNEEMQETPVVKDFNFSFPTRHSEPGRPEQSQLLSLTRCAVCVGEGAADKENDIHTFQTSASYHHLTFRKKLK